MGLQKLSIFNIILASYLLGTAFCQSASKIHKIPLRVAQNYEYFATLGFGSNLQQLEVQVDTGSRAIAVFCDICEKGCVLEEELKTSESTTFSNITCGKAKELTNLYPFKSQALETCLEDCKGKPDNQKCLGDLTYGAGGVGSYLDYELGLEEIGVLNSQSKVYSTFGCIYKERRFKKGIWGVGFTPQNQFLDAIYLQDSHRGLNPSKVFTICTNGTDSVMNIGGVDSQFHVGEGVTVGVDNTHHSWWKLKEEDIGQISIQSKVVRSPTTSFGIFGIILDSGTNVIILPSKVVWAIRSVIESFCSKQSDLCEKDEAYEIFDVSYRLKDAAKFFKSVPMIDIQFKGKVLSTPASNYFWRINEDRWALGLVTAQKYGFPMSILGSIWMNNFDIVFDSQKSQIQIHDITRCSNPSRLLQSEPDLTVSDDPYELPQTVSSFNSYQHLANLKAKHSKNIKKMNP